MLHATDILIAAQPPVMRAGWIDALAPLVLIVVYVIRQVFTAMAEQREAQRVQRRLPENPEQAGAPPAEAPQQELRSEVDEFLRRVNEAREGRPPQGPPPQEQPAPRRGPIDPFEEPAPRQTVRPEPRESPIELLVEPVAPPLPEPELPHLPESQLAEEAAHLGERIASADDRTEARLHKKFDHRLGKIDQNPTTAEEPEPTPPTAASRIKGLLAKPGGVREAVVLSEILRRPGDNL